MDVAARLSTAGIAGIIVPSFANGAGLADIEAVFWNWTSAAQLVTVIDPDGRLPKDQSSWR